MKFIGRKEQIKKLNREIHTDLGSTILIYGRRRVGKSELVKYLIRESVITGIYYECKQTTEMNNVESLCRVISEVLSLPKLGYTDIESVLDYLYTYAGERKVVLVLDEYPYLRESVKGMDSILQSLIDRYKEKSELKLILLGSYVDVMRSLMEHANPLFGRVDCTIDLKPMDYYESAQFYPNFSEEDKVRVYSVFGGIPYYNRMIDDRESVKDNIIRLIASPGARLENEISMYLSGEISKIVNSNEVFDALSKGYSKYKDILSQSHVSSGPTLVDVMNKLIGMELVIREAPINDENNKKKAGYRICDNLTLFYYRYIFRYSSQMNILDPEVFFDKYISRDFEETYVPNRFEDICRQYLIRKNRQGEIAPLFTKIGKYYYDDPVNHKNGEFDVVTEDEKGYVFCEAKFRKTPITEAMIREEIELVKAAGMNCDRYVFISRSGFSCAETEQTKHIVLNELFI